MINVTKAPWNPRAWIVESDELPDWPKVGIESLGPRFKQEYQLSEGRGKPGEGQPRYVTTLEPTHDNLDDAITHARSVLERHVKLAQRRAGS